MLFAIEKLMLDKGQDAHLEVVDFVERQPFDFVMKDSGSFGQVYLSKTEKRLAYKIGDFGDNVGYLSYIEAIQKLEQQNPFLPVIFRVRYYLNHDHTATSPSGTFLVAMERLQPRESEIHENMCNALSDLTAQFLNNATSRVKKNDKEFTALLAHLFPFGKLPIDKKNQLLEAIQVVTSSYQDATAQVRKRSKKCQMTIDLDMHDANFMVRESDGYLVFTDPIA